jgi:hypothetical protein
MRRGNNMNDWDCRRASGYLGLPVNNVASIPLDTAKIYIYTYWNDLTAHKKCKYKCLIYDGEGALIATSTAEFRPDDIGWEYLDRVWDQFESG